MIRICRPNSTKVLILQHGICDSPYTWIANGCSNSLAYRAWDCGFDIFLTSFRGVAPRGHIDPTKTNYWDFSVDELAKYDLTASIEKIREIKKEELGNTRSEKVQYSYIGHSMGGMVLLMYLINCKLHKKPHYLNKAILLSPAGSHIYSPKMLRIIGWMIGEILGKVITKVQIPDCVNSTMLKLLEDIQQLPAAKSIISFLGTNLVGGNYDSDASPISLNRILHYNLISYVFFNTEPIKI